MQVIRYDLSSFKAKKTKEGYLVDTPIVGRTGIQSYKMGDGSIRRELRLPEEVFAQDSLESFKGKPVTYGHPKEMVTAKNAKTFAVGSMNSDGWQDGNNLRVDITVYDQESIDKAINGGVNELSLGYTVDIEETAGEWGGQPYDAIQRNPRINHLAIVPRGRAGNARLNLDRFDAVLFNNIDNGDYMSDNLSRIRLDSGLEYQAAPEVIVEFEKIRDDKKQLSARADDLQKQVDKLSAERDTLQSQVASIEKVRADALDIARAEVKARIALDKVADAFKIDSAGKTDREIKELVIKSIREDADLSAKSDDYIDAAFDIAVAIKNDVAIAAQRAAGAKNDSVQKVDKADGTYAGFMAKLGKGA